MTPDDDPRAPAFADDEALAEALSFAVWCSLRAGLPLHASLLQPVAATAWGRVAGAAGPRELLRDARRARRALRMMVRAGRDRALLDAAIEHARAGVRAERGRARKIAGDRG